MYGVPVPMVLPPAHAMMGFPFVAMGLPPPPPSEAMIAPAAPAPSAAADGSSGHVPDPVQALFEVLADRGVGADGCRRALRRLGPHAGRLLMANGDSLLHYAAKQGRVDLVRLLVEPPAPGTGDDAATPAVDAAARADLLAWRNHQGYTALHAALAAGQEACGLVLVHAGGPEARKAPTGTPEGAPPVVLAAAMNLPVVVRALLAYGIGLETRDARQWTPLHAACAAGHGEMVAWLVDERGANVQAVDEQGRRPHDLAMRGGHSQVFAFMHARLTGRVGGFKKPPQQLQQPPMKASGPPQQQQHQQGEGGKEEGGTAAEREERRRQKEREKRRRRKANAQARQKQAATEGGGASTTTSPGGAAGQGRGEEGDEDEEGLLAGAMGDLIVLRARALSQDAGALDDDDEKEDNDDDDDHSLSLSLSAASASASGLGSGSGSGAGAHSFPSPPSSGPATAESAGTDGDAASTLSFLVGDMEPPSPAAEVEGSRLFDRWRPEARAASEGEEEEGRMAVGRAARVVVVDGSGSDGEVEEEQASLEALLRARAPAEYLCPLSGSLMRTAVVAMDGVAYEQAALEGYMEAAAAGAWSAWGGVVVFSLID